MVGLGVKGGRAEWGMMVNEGRKVMLRDGGMMMRRGVGMVIIVMGFKFL